MKIRVKEARTILGCTTDKLYKYVSAGRLKAYPPKPGHLSDKFDEDQVRQLSIDLVHESGAMRPTPDKPEVAPIRTTKPDGTPAPKPAHKPVPHRQVDVETGL